MSSIPSASSTLSNSTSGKDAINSHSNSNEDASQQHNTLNVALNRRSPSLSMSNTEAATETTISIDTHYQYQHIETANTMFKNVNDKINQFSKCIVFGYIENITKETLHFEIPSIIYDICLIYYSDIEYFTKIAYRMTTFNGCHEIDGYDGNGTTYGNIEINNKECIKYIWDFKLLTMEQSIIAIGIEACKSNKRYIDRAFHEQYVLNPNPFYGVEMLSMGGYSFKYSQNIQQEPYGQGIEDGDQIKMILNVKNKTLRYYINEIDQGIAFNNIDFQNNTTYFMAVYGWKAVRIILTDFRQIYIE